MELLNWIRGLLRVQLTGADLTRTLGRICDAGILVQNVNRVDELTLRATVELRCYPQLCHICSRQGDTIRELRRFGAVPLAGQILSRPVLWLGALFLAVAAALLPTRVLFIEVQGNETVPARYILSEAERCGIVFGVSRKAVRSEKMKNALLSRIPELEWAGINTAGCRAVILVRERPEPVEREEGPGISSVIAGLDGYILTVEATRGTRLCQPGQSVLAGEVLISGYSDQEQHLSGTRARGEVFARTRRELTVISPVQRYARREQERMTWSFSLLIGKKRINLWKDSGILDTSCDRIYDEYYASLPGGFRLPFGIAVERCNSYSLQADCLPETVAAQALERQAKDYLRSHMIAGTIQSATEQVQIREDVAILTGQYDCVEMIGREQTEKIGDIHG